MIVELTPETFFETVRTEGPLHVVMHYGATCGPCKMTMPFYEAVATHFELHRVTNVKFYLFHQWEQSYKDFINNSNLKTSGVPTFRYYYFGDVLNEEVRSYNNADELKSNIMEVVKGIEQTMGGFDLYAN
jgi:thiol-disulfide isomerase/thioredoxin